MIRVCAVVSLVAVLLTSAATAEEPSSKDQVGSAALHELVRTQVSPDLMDDLYADTAGNVTNQFQAVLQPGLKRAFTESEKQRVYLFWYQKMKEMLPYSVLENLIAPVLAKHLTPGEIDEIDRFYRTQVGKKLTSLGPTVYRESKAAGEELGRKLADPKWIATATEQLKKEVPSLFPDEEPKP